MNSDNLAQLLQQGFHITLGATSFLIETLQDPQKREENLNKLQSDFSQLPQEWAQKGEMTEREARNFVDTILAQQNNASDSPKNGDNPDSPTSSPPASSAQPVQSDVQQEIQALTAQIAALRAELENLRIEDSQS